RQAAASVAGQQLVPTVRQPGSKYPGGGDRFGRTGERIAVDDDEIRPVARLQGADALPSQDTGGLPRDDGCNAPRARVCSIGGDGAEIAAEGEGDAVLVGRPVAGGARGRRWLVPARATAHRGFRPVRREP